MNKKQVMLQVYSAMVYGRQPGPREITRSRRWEQPCAGVVIEDRPVVRHSGSALELVNR